MSDIRAVLFWLTGVVVQSVPAALATLETVFDLAPGRLRGLFDLSADVDALAIGRIPDDALFARLNGAAGRTISSEQWRSALMAAFQPDLSALESIGRLPEAYQRWLIVDLPSPWFDGLRGRVDLTPWFPPEHTIVLDHGGLPRLEPDVYYHATRAIHLPAAHCLFIDPRLRRAIQGVNQRFSVAHYVNARLLDREFYLRGFTGPVKLHPTPTLLPQSP
jgi:beta-phosphoglucomutase-like phosphatase (HAD superfamily)